MSSIMEDLYSSEALEERQKEDARIERKLLESGWVFENGSWLHRAFAPTVPVPTSRAIGMQRHAERLAHGTRLAASVAKVTSIINAAIHGQRILRLIVTACPCQGSGVEEVRGFYYPHQAEKRRCDRPACVEGRLALAALDEALAEGGRPELTADVVAQISWPSEK